MSTLLIKNARYIVSCDDQDSLHERCNLFIRDQAIEYIGPALRQADQVIDASRMAVYPGLINTHHHLYQLFSRNLPEVQKMELFPWLVTLYEVWKNLDEEVVSWSSLAGMGELLKNGCTTCFDHHYVFPERSGDLIAAQFRSADTVGMRFHASRGSMDLSKKDGGLPPDSVVQTIDAILADSERLVRVWHDDSRFSMHRLALAPCSPFSVSGDLLRESARLARSLGVRLHTHVAETKDEEQYTLERFGLRPVAYMQSLGWTGPDVWYAHGIHFNDRDLRVLAETGTGVAHCPISNMKLASGVCRLPDLLRLDIPVGLAVDGSASRRPRYWDTTTAPPVDRAAKIWISSMLSPSTRDTPDTAASPAVVTITVSAMPTVISSSCSMTSGMISRSSACRENSGARGCEAVNSIPVPLPWISDLCRPPYSRPR